MSRRETVLQLLEAINNRDFEGVRNAQSAEARFVAPGLDLDLAGRDAIVAEIRAAVEQGELRYDIHEVLERGPFVVAFATSTGMIDGYPMGWELCAVYRFDGDKVAETWVVRGSPPQPLS